MRTFEEAFNTSFICDKKNKQALNNEIGRIFN